MKLKVGKIGLFFRLVAVTTALLFGQQAMAIGTAAGTQIDNTATVDFDVNGVDQTDLVSSVSFVVDRRVDFTLSQLGTALVPVTPAQVPVAFFDFLLTNDSNSPLDFRLALSELVGPDTVRGVLDTANMDIVDYAVSADTQSGGLTNTDPDPVRLGPQFVDELPADATIRIRVFGEAVTMLDAQVAGVQIDAIAAEAGVVGGPVGADLLDGVANSDLGIENVFADNPLPGPGPGGDGIETNNDGFVVASAALAVTKSYSVIAGDLSSGLPIPGATVEYTIEMINSSTTDADAIVMTDVLDALVSIDRDVYSATSDIEVINDGATVPCDIDDGPDADGCTFAGVTLTVGDPPAPAGTGLLDLVVAGNTTLTISYQITIPDPDPTP